MSVPGLRLAFSWLTVLPVRTPRVDAATARSAIGMAPLVGLPLSFAALGFLAVLHAFGMPGLLAGLLAAGLLAGLTRGMHLDGLADTADGLGCYGPPDRALAVMREGGAGPFAVVTLIIVVGAQAISLGGLVPSGHWAVVVVAMVAGRAAFAICCQHGIPAARPDGMGALVAGSQPPGVVLAWWLPLGAAAGLAMWEHWWQGILAVALAGGAVVLLARHARKRFGGITGDVLGAACEIASTVVLVVCVR